MPGWSGRVEVVPGTGGTTFVPGEVIVRVESEADAQTLLDVLGLERPGADAPAAESQESARPDYAPQAPAPQLTPMERLLAAGADQAGPHVRFREVGDVLGTILLLRGAGLKAQPNHVFFAHGAGESWAGYGAIGAYSVAGNPVVGHPVVGHPVVGHPVVGHPVVGHPVVGHPVVGHTASADIGRTAGCGCGCGTSAASNPCDWNLHCCESDPCTCTRPRGQGSPIYPSPLFARAFYSEQVALRYELTGVRPSAALPLYLRDDTELPANSDWTHDAIRVAVIDTGWPIAYDKPHDKLKVATGVTDGSDAAKPDDWDQPDTDGDEYLDPVAGHGLFIAGLLVQYAPGVSVKVVKALSSFGDGDEWEIADRIRELTASDCKPHIINLSFGTYAPEQPDLMAEAVREAIRAGIVVVASAGNDGTSRPSYPAAYPGVVSVAALGPDGPASFSNWGSSVRACAPGVDVASCFWIFDGKTSGEAGGDRDQYEGWALWSGTSFAAPLVAAALAAELQNQKHVENVVNARKAVARVIDHPHLFRLPCFGTVINPAPKVAGL